MATILIIDDEQSVLTLLRNVLESANYNVIEAFNGEEGLNLYHEKKPDLIITDILMFGKGGFELIRELTQNFPDVKIIAMSGGGVTESNDFLPFAKELGATRAIEKPFEPNELLKIVNELLYK